METNQLVKLAASGNVKDVEEAWLRLLDDEFDAQRWCDRARVLKTLADRDNPGEAETLASTALEAFANSAEPNDVLPPAGAFLRAVKKSQALRDSVAKLYRTVYADTEGLEALLSEAGVEGGRPARRALRTMDVCLRLDEGQCLVHRHEPGAVRVESVDRDDWTIDVFDGKKHLTYGAVELADNYAPAADDDFHVMALFDREGLTQRLDKDPGSVVENILQASGDEMSSDELKRMLSPRFVTEGNWSKWWTRTRQALRKNRHIRLEGRAPYYLKYEPTTLSLEEEVDTALAKAHDPVRELALIEQYLKDCKAQGETPSPDLLDKAGTRIRERAERMERNGARLELLPYLIAQRIAEYRGDEEASEYVMDALKRADDAVTAILAVHDASFWPAACNALEQSHPTDLVDALKRLLPHAPIRVADHLAEYLVGLGETHECFRQLADQILREPVKYAEGVVWLWNGPSHETARVAVPLATILTRMLAALGEVQRGGEHFTRDRIRQIVGISRDALKARRFARFKEMLEHVEPGVASALRTQIARLDNLARTGDDLLRMIREKFPQLTKADPTLPPWLRDEALFGTEAGHARRHAELEELVNVKMRENAIAIGAAAELGDLSENSEYKFALEERDLLQARLAQMQREMESYQVLRAEDVPAEYVGIGSRVALEHVETGTRQEITILGPWEANPDERIYNYRTPLAQSILGTRQGENTEVEFFDPPGAYRVVEITNALTEATTA
jgi:transcription elongation GreA/GreB family factor